MSKDRPTYVIDTNVLVDYVDIIPSSDGPNKPPEEPTIDLSQADLVIPTVVVRELSKFKKEKTERGRAARIVLKRIREIVENEIRTMGEVYNLEAPVKISYEGQTLSVLPVHKNFHQMLPFHPSSEDMDGQIILTTLTVAFLKAGLPIDGTASLAEREQMLALRPDVVLLTNDNGLAIRARERGLKTERYGYKYPAPYTGRRDIVVPNELLEEFLANKGYLSREDFEKMMPDQSELIANEFIVMQPENPTGYYSDGDDPYFERIGRYDRREDAIVKLQYISSFPTQVRNPGQAIYAEALMNPNISAVICTGPAGSGKTYMATIYGYTACKQGSYIGVTVVPCESHSKLGALPGDLDEKMDPDVQPIKNAIRNYLLSEDSSLRKDLDGLREFGTGKAAKKAKRTCNGDLPDEESQERKPDKRSIKTKLKDRVDLIWENWFTNVPIEHARGRDFTCELAIYDEFQDQNAMQADTLIKRIGADGKIILTGDIEQIHSAYLDKFDNGLVYASRQLFDDPMVAQVCFREDEVIRHPLVRLIAKRQEAARKKPNED